VHVPFFSSRNLIARPKNSGKLLLPIKALYVTLCRVLGVGNPIRVELLSYIMETKASGAENPEQPGPLPDELAWRVHPLTESFWRSSLLLTILIAALVGVYFWTGYPGMVLLAAILLAASLAPYLFPTRYRVDCGGIEIAFLGVRNFRSWKEFRNFYPHDLGVHLSTFRVPSGLDPFRGSFIRFAPDNREIVLRFMDAHIRRAESGSSGQKP